MAANAGADTPADAVVAEAPAADEAATPAATDDGRKGILMLCLGNICRSPAAEAVMNGILDARDLKDQFFVDSCGTGGGSPDWYMDGCLSHHEGAPPDTRMQYAAEQRGLSLDTESRPLNKDDFNKFHMIVAMDSTNIEAVETARAHWGVEDPKAKVVLLSDFSTTESFRGQGVPDPYWSRQNGFEHALDLIQESCDGLANHITAA